MANGNLFVDSWFNDSVFEFDRTTGATIGTFASSELDGPFGIIFRPNGNLIVSNFFGSNLLEYDGNTRAFVGVFGTAGPASGPGDLEFGPNGNLFNADWTANTVEEFDATTGAWVGTFASGGGLNRPYYLVFKPLTDSDGDGVDDDVDACPNSDLGSTIIINGEETSVENDLLADGCSLADLIAEVLANDPSTSDIVQFLVDLKGDGALTGQELGAMLQAINNP